MAKQDPSDLQERRVLVVFVGTMDLLGNKGSGAQQDHQAAQETKATLERTAPR